MLKVFAAALLAVSASGQPASAPLRIALPGIPWAFKIDAPGFVVKQSGVQQDGRWSLLAERGPEVLSVMLEGGREKATLDSCKGTLRARTQSPLFEISGVKQAQQGEMATMEYMVRELGGQRIDQKNLFGCLVKENVYVDVHLSKAKFEAADQTSLTTVLNSARFVPAALPEVTSMSLFEQGSRAFKAQDFARSIPPYRQALELEKKEQKLSAPLWRVLIDNLAMAHGITGDLKSSEAVLQYGLSKDPTYPMFHYIMANMYGEKRDLKNTLKWLRSALDNKANMNPGETLPNPLTDDSFSSFVKNDEFKKLASEFR